MLQRCSDQKLFSKCKNMCLFGKDPNNCSIIMTFLFSINANCDSQSIISTHCDSNPTCHICQTNHNGGFFSYHIVPYRLCPPPSPHYTALPVGIPDLVWIQLHTALMLCNNVTVMSVLWHLGHLWLLGVTLFLALPNYDSNIAFSRITNEAAYNERHHCTMVVNVHLI